MVAVLSARQLTDAELGCRLLIVRIHDLCRYVRGEVRPFYSGTQDESFSVFVAFNTLPAQRELDTTPINANHPSTVTLVGRHLFSESMAQHLAVAIAGKLPAVVYRGNYHYPTAFAAVPEIAFDVAQAYGDHRIAAWQDEPEDERVADCQRFREWIDSFVPPTLLWKLWQRLEQERILYLAWAADRGTPIDYSAPYWGSLDQEYASALSINPHYLGLGEAALRRDVDAWGEAQQSTTTGNEFIERLLAGPDHAELTPTEFALLEAHLQQPISLAAIQQEKKATGESETSAKRNKLKLIRDYNRNLQPASYAPTPANPQLADADQSVATGFLGGAELAEALGVHSTRRDAFFQELGRKRISLGDDCWHEVREPRPNSPRFLYRVDSPNLRALASDYRNPKPT